MDDGDGYQYRGEWRLVNVVGWFGLRNSLGLAMSESGLVPLPAQYDGPAAFES
jgi:hypothetical protein